MLFTFRNDIQMTDRRRTRELQQRAHDVFERANEMFQDNMYEKAHQLFKECIYVRWTITSIVALEILLKNNFNF